MHKISKDSIFVLFNFILLNLKKPEPMKKAKKLKWKHFRHLTSEEFDNPLLPLIELCCSETDLYYLREDTHRFIRATSCHNVDFDEENYGEMFFFYQRFQKHIELLYLLAHRYPDWKASIKSPLYQLKIIGRSYTLVDDDIKGETTLNFRKLSKNEVMDIGLFMNKFFNFMTLQEWRDTMDDLIRAVFSRESFSEYEPQAFHIYEYLEKLSEAMFLTYEIRGKAYMLEHHADRFGIKRKKLVDAEANRADANA